MPATNSASQRLSVLARFKLRSRRLEAPLVQSCHSGPPLRSGLLHNAQLLSGSPLHSGLLHNAQLLSESPLRNARPRTGQLRKGWLGL